MLHAWDLNNMARKAETERLPHARCTSRQAPEAVPASTLHGVGPIRLCGWSTLERAAPGGGWWREAAPLSNRQVRTLAVARQVKELAALAGERPHHLVTLSRPMNWKLSSVCCAGLEKEPASDLGYGAGHHDRALTREMVKTQRFRCRTHIGWNRVHFNQPRAGWVPEVRGMSLPDNSIRFLNSIGCIAEPLGDGRYIIGRHPRAAACAVKFLGCIFDAETKFPETPATLGF
jgi:hypothetical protein